MTLQEILDLADEISADCCVKEIMGERLALAYVPYESGESFLDRLSVELGYNPRCRGAGPVSVAIQKTAMDNGSSIAILKIEVD